VRAPRRVTIALAASKQTTAHLVVRTRAGKVVLERRLALGRFGARVALPLRRAGSYSVSLGVRAINGRGARMTRTIMVTKPPKPKPKPTKKAKKPRPSDRAKKPPAKAKDAPLVDAPAASATDHGSAKRTKPGS
jgi:hypothetical protein